MPGVARLTDIGSGHGCWPEHEISTASENVFIEGLGAARLDDVVKKHCCKHHGCHEGYIIEGSSTVFVNGKPLARLDDAVGGDECGGKIITASSTVFAG